MPDTDKCPLCGGKVLYRGFTAIECASRKEQCRNASRTVLDLNGAIAWYDAYGGWTVVVPVVGGYDAYGMLGRDPHNPPPYISNNIIRDVKDVPYIKVRTVNYGQDPRPALAGA